MNSKKSINRYVMYYSMLLIYVYKLSYKFWLIEDQDWKKIKNKNIHP